MAREHPRYANMEFPDYEYREFPMMVYPGAPDQKKPYGKNGRPLRGVIVNDEAEYAKVMTAEAGAKPVLVSTGAAGVERVQSAEDERLAALKNARELGIPNVDGRWSLARIESAVDAYTAARAE